MADFGDDGSDVSETEYLNRIVNAGLRKNKGKSKKAKKDKKDKKTSTAADSSSAPNADATSLPASGTPVSLSTSTVTAVADGPAAPNPNTSALPIPGASTSSELGKPVLSFAKNHKFRYLSKEDRQREKEAEEEAERRRQEEEKRLQEEKDRAEHRRFWQKIRRGDFSHLGNGDRDDRNGHGSGNSRKRGREDDEVKLTPQEKAEYERMRARYLGPDMSKSKFTVKKRRQGAQEFKFNWDDDEDTRNPADKVDPDAAYRHRLTSSKIMNVDPQEESKELEALKRADRARSGEKGEERARQIMEEYYRGRDYRNRSLRNMKHWTEKSLDEMRERDWRIFKEDFSIATRGGAIPNPMRSWRESALPPALLNIVESVGYNEPTPIQRAAIPIALQGRDLIGVAVTGSGKTAAFLLPLLVYIKELPPLDDTSKNDGPYALILAPTRELAQQIEAEARKFATPFGYTVVSIVGGHSLEEQAFALRNGAEIVVATPGRLVDCIERRLLVLSQCCYVIMDEADRMIDLGFEDPLNKILDAMPTANEKPDSEEAEDAQAMTQYLGRKFRYRETMMYTATMPPLVEKIAKRYLRRPAFVTIGNVGEAVNTVEQRVEFIPGEDRRKKRLQEILHSNAYAPPIIVFVNIKNNCEMVAKDIRSMGFSTVTLHGSKTQEQREAALATLRQGKADVLVATDLAGRGIDVSDVSLVINFNMASSIEQYTHRIGRTGRAGKTGVAITFLGNEDSDVLYDLKQMISKSTISKLPDELRRHEAAQQKPSKTKRFGQ